MSEETSSTIGRERRFKPALATAEEPVADSASGRRNKARPVLHGGVYEWARRDGQLVEVRRCVP